MEEIKVKIRRHGDPFGKLLRFNKSIELRPLLLKVANKLSEDDVIAECYASRHQLLLDGKYVVCNVSEIDDGDELVLRKMDNTTAEVGTPPTQTSNSSSAVTPVTKMEEQSGGLPIKVEPYVAREVISLLEDDSDVKPDTSTSWNSQAGDPTPRSAGGKRKMAPIAASEEPRLVQRPKKTPVIITIDDDSDEDTDSSKDGSIEDGSDARVSSEEDEKKEDEEFEPGDSYESENEIGMRKLKRGTCKLPPLQILMDEKDVPSAPGKREGNNEDEQHEEVSLLVDEAGRKKTDKAVKDRIMKLLYTGFHDQSNEYEAKNAMKLAQRLMRKHNLSQALLLKERDGRHSSNQTKDGILKGGMVHVRIINRKTQKPALFARWLGDLAYHVGINFDVKYFMCVRRGRKCEVTFYGIYTNAQLAGYAFRVAAERISQMGAMYEPRRRPNISLASCRLSYCIGVVKGIGDEVKRNIQEEKRKRVRKLERARLAVSKGEAYEDSDEDESGESENDGAAYSFRDRTAGCENGANEGKRPSVAAGIGNKDSSKTTHEPAPLERQKGASPVPMPPVLSGKALDRRLQELENENQSALVLVDHRNKVAEDVLKDNGVKLSARRRRGKINFDGKSYRRGIVDSKEVDINQRAIRGETKVKREMKKE